MLPLAGVSLEEDAAELELLIAELLEEVALLDAACELAASLDEDSAELELAVLLDLATKLLEDELVAICVDLSAPPLFFK